MADDKRYTRDYSPESDGPSWIEFAVVALVTLLVIASIYWASTIGSNRIDNYLRQQAENPRQETGLTYITP